MGSRWSQREALPNHKATVKWPNRCLEVGAESEGPHLSSIALLVGDGVDGVLSQAAKSLDHQRKKSIPEEQQAERLSISSVPKLGEHDQVFGLFPRW